MKNKSLILSAFVAVFAILIIINSVNALNDYACVEASVTDISPSSVGIGEEFTVGIQIENCGNTIPEFVSFELLNPPKDITIKEPLVIEISKLYYGNSERFITYHMRTNSDAIPGTHLIKTKLTYGSKSYPIVKDSEIRFEVQGEKAEINIASVKTKPVLPLKGDTVELTIRIENIGEGVAKSIKIYADHPFQGIKQTFIGSLKLNEDGPSIFTFIANKSGEIEFPVTISYSDDFGEKEVKTNVGISVLEKPSNIGSIIFSIMFIVLIGGGVYYFFKIKKSKDKIIHQLLKGNNLREKEKK